ncbi:MAG: glycosyltransferase [Chromatiaceae bacterium]|nr:glycosyltransferase [Chromatiaceae bacterium]
MKKPVILFATPVLHHPPVGGPTLRIENSIKALAQISDLYLYSRTPLDQMGDSRAVDFYRQFCRDLYFAPFPFVISPYQRFIRRAINYLSRRLLGRSLVSVSMQRQEDYRHLLRMADRIKADVIWLGFGNISYPLLGYIKERSSYKVVVDTDSVWSRFILRGLPYANNEKEREETIRNGKSKEEEERVGTPLSDVTTAVSEIDADYYRSFVESPERVRIFSNVIDLEMYRNIPSAPSGFKSPCMYLAGTFWQDSPMEDAARWIVENVLPTVRREIPNIHFYIVGSGSDHILADLQDPGITVTGRLDSVLPWLGHADVTLVPLRYESGTRFKILEAGACRRPVVSTTLGAEGIPVTHGHDILIADQAEEFSSAVVRIIRDSQLGRDLGENLHTLVSANYSIDALEREGRDILDHLLQMPALD